MRLFLSKILSLPVVMLKKARKHPGLFLLILILTVITSGMLKPDFFLAGWDNFSSYLNLKSTFFNTFFATWREHRGLGVPSDAEVNDIFRQIFYTLISPFVKKELLDQLYMALMLWGGVLGMYALGRHISHRNLKQPQPLMELFGFSSGFFYLFNLSTLAVFYFPMIMYVTRFFMLPTTFLVILNLLEKKRISVPFYVLSLVILFVGFGAYMVPTIFIVMMLALGLFFLVLGNKKRVLVVLFFYITFGLFWILPFGNYTLQKSKIVPMAPTFIEINESMINKPKSYYTFERQAKMRPSFFESQFFNNTTGKKVFFHEIAGVDEQGTLSMILWIFPLLYLASIAYVVFFRRNRVLISFSLLELTFLVLSMKEYSIFGFIYGWLTDHIPFASTIFRFGDTKFHALVAFSGSVLAALLITAIGEACMKFRLKIVPAAGLVLLGCMAILHLFVFKSYFTGNMIGFFMYNKIPSAYFDLASIINKDPEPVRVIQLPLDSHTYWKPYSWGYFGSAFLHFMLNKPLFDRTFEPATLEGSQIHQQFMDIVHLSSSAIDDADLEKRAMDLYRLMSSLSIKYVIDDQTVSTNIDARNIVYWGTIKPADTHRVLNYLNKRGYLKIVKEYRINPQDYSQDYSKLYPYNKKQVNYTYPPRSLTLFSLASYEPRMQFIPELDKVHTANNTLLPRNIVRNITSNYIQSLYYDNQSFIFPFAVKNKSVSIQSDVRINYPYTLQPGSYLFSSQGELDKVVGRQINLYGTAGRGSITITMEELAFPLVSNTINETAPNTYSVEIPSTRDASYVDINGTVLKIMNLSDGKRHFLGSVIIHESHVSLRLLYPEETYNVSDRLTQLEPEPRCLNDALYDPESRITGDNGVLFIAGKNASNCLTTSIPLNTETSESKNISYCVLEFKTQGTVQALQPINKNIDSGKPRLDEQIRSLPNPLTMNVCIKPEGSITCTNSRQLYRVNQKQTFYEIPALGDFNGIKQLTASFQVRSAQPQSYETQTTNILLRTYSSGDTVNISLRQPPVIMKSLILKKVRPLELSFPLPSSPFTQTVNFNADTLLVAKDADCDDPDKYHATKVTDQGFLSYAVGCRNNLNKNIAFSSSNFYLWQVQYQHLSGAIPALILMDKFNTYFYQKLLPPGINPNDYFNLPYQKPESLVDKGGNLSRILENTPYRNVSGFILPEPDLNDQNNKEFIIEHYSQNEGVVRLRSMSLIDLPDYWQNSVLKPADYHSITPTAISKVISIKRFLPSFWKVTAESTGGTAFFLFNEQYDVQWKIFKAGVKNHASCNGYANCYILDLPKGKSSFYLFYIPELLSAGGWIITLAAVATGFFFFTRK